MIFPIRLPMTLLALCYLSNLMANSPHSLSCPNNTPDLTLSNLQLPATTITQGEIFYFDFVANNIGTIGTGNFTIKSYISSDQILSADDFQDGIIPTGNFPPDFSTAVTGALTIPAGFPPGNYYLTLKIDADDDIAESNESNNIIASSSFTIEESNDNNVCPTSINGFTVLGEYEGHKYFLSNDVTFWTIASATAAANGGHLASINSAEENEFIRSVLGNNIVFIGYNDTQTEGNLQWDSGQPVTYTNLEGGNSPDGDFAYMNFWSGGWTLTNQFVQKPYILEVVCGDNNTVETDCSFMESYSIPTTFADYTTIEETNDGYQIIHRQDTGINVHFNTIHITPDGSIQGTSSLTLPTKNRSQYGDFAYEVSFVQEENAIRLSAMDTTNTLWSTNIFLGDDINSSGDFSISEFDDAIIIGGRIQQDSGNNPFFIKTDLNGNLHWVNTYDLVSYSSVGGFTPAQDGGHYAIVFNYDTNRSARVIKIDATGNLLWESQEFGSLHCSRFHAIGEAKDGSGYYTGYSGGTNRPAFINKLDVTTGETIWFYQMEDALGDGMGTSYASIDGGQVLLQDGGILIGYKYRSRYGTSEGHDWELRFLRFNSDGTLLWNRLYPNGLGAFYATISTSDGGFILQQNWGNIISFIKVNSDGLPTPLCNNNYPPDISISGLRIYAGTNNPGKFAVGHNLNILYDINHSGLAPFSGEYTIGVYLKSNTDQQEFFAGSFPVNGGSFGVLDNNLGSITIPDVPLGYYDVILRADDGNTIVEFDESNNEKEGYSINIVPELPDLMLDNLSAASNNLTQGEVLNFTFSIANKGFANSGNFSIKFYLYSQDNPDDDPYPAGTIATGNFDPNFVVDNVMGAFTIPPDLPTGTYGLIARADPDDLVEELNESNNLDYFGTITISENESGTCPQTFPNAAYLGEHNDHAYFDGEVAIARNTSNEKIDAFAINDPYPNPASEYIMLDVNSLSEESIKVQIYDATGKAVANKNMQLVAGKNTLRFDVADFQSGLYFLTVKRTHGEVISKRFVRSR